LCLFIWLYFNEKEKHYNDYYSKATKAKRDTFFYNGAFLPAKWMREHGALTDEDFIKMIEEYNGKVLAITGSGDVQADSNALKRLEQFAHVITYTSEMVNHMLREVDEVSIMKIKKQYKEGSKKIFMKGQKKQ